MSDTKRRVMGGRLPARGGWVVMALIFLSPASGRADEAPLVRAKEKVVIDRVGDARFAIDVKMPVAVYTLLKDQTRNTALLLRQIGLSQEEHYQIDDLKGEFDDGNSTLRFTWTTRGLARQVRDQVWEAPVDDSTGLELLYIKDNVALLNTACHSTLGVVPMVLQAEIDHGADLQILHSPNRLAYRNTQAPSAPGSRTSFDIEFETKPQVMTCLAKSYGNPKFGKFWVGRTVLKNTGGQHLTDYRVRFRLGEYAPTWSAWKHCTDVVPGQTVADTYFPIFDLDKVGRLSGSCRDTLEMEYQYRRPDGQLVEGSDSRMIQLLGRNEAFFSSHKLTDCVSYFDQNDYGPAILASFVTKDDPIMQQVAGWVSGQAGGVAADSSDANAIRFLQALYEFMAGNGISYQTPPGGEFNGQFGQHIKYGRDVLQNRAGTCVDLAIFYGSVCEAVGLKPVLFLVPGHCFPAIRLPQSGKIFAVETTGVPQASFAQVCTVGMKEVEDVRKKGLVFEVDIVQLHNQGIYGLQLPTLPTTALTDWGIHPVTKNSTQAVASVERTRASVPTWLVGKWKCDTKLDDTTIQMVAELGRDGRYELCLRHSNEFGTFTKWTHEYGGFEVGAEELVLMPAVGPHKDSTVKRKFAVEGGYLWLSFKEIGYQLPFTRPSASKATQTPSAAPSAPSYAPAPAYVYVPAPNYVRPDNGGNRGLTPGRHHRGR